LASSPDKVQGAIKAVLDSLGEPAAQDLARYIEAECGFNIDKISTVDQLQCVEKTLREIFGTAADLLIQLMHQELGK
jgi:hypothetical protein